MVSCYTLLVNKKKRLNLIKIISLPLVTPIRASRPSTTTTEISSSINPIIPSNIDESTPLIESKTSALVSNDHRPSKFYKFLRKKIFHRFLF